MLSNSVISNLISSFNQPFTPKMLANMTESDQHVVEAILDELLKEEKIKCISQGNAVYVRANRYSTGISIDPNCKWRYDVNMANRLLDLIESKSYRSIRDLAIDFGKSRQLVFVYLEALASISIIGINPHGYYIKTRLGIEYLGQHIQPGILGVLKKYSGISHLKVLRMRWRYRIE
ncbi:MAG: hypothetical protein CVU48_04050 [Candidatus Cloacimonetes bacterium HGW-Cloacimonetes-1]|jgi:hypothetical protein|nr:MAG: hypothetical protein CVU48_04050 [Candidatus Cloacimonetes bacterium HGW-Cloacimonetes-1]